MHPLLFDEGLPGGASVSTALVALEWEARTVGSPGAPPSGSADDINCRWCKSNQAILVTHDRGKTNREILKLLDQFEVSAIMVFADLRRQPPRHLARALLLAEGEIDAIISGRRRLRHRLRASGHLTKPK